MDRNLSCAKKGTNFLLDPEGDKYRFVPLLAGAAYSGVELIAYTA